MLALIGDTGFVGKNLMEQLDFDVTYNSRTIAQIKSCDTIWCAGVPGVKWFANQEPLQDKASIDSLQSHLSGIDCNKMYLISTIDAIVNPHQPYGRHRLELEEWMCSRFDTTVVRLPGLFGNHLRKNTIYDLMNGRYNFVNLSDCYQWYYLGDLVADVERGLTSLMTEPVSNLEIASVLGVDVLAGTFRVGSPIVYDLCPYVYDRQQVLDKLKGWYNDMCI